MYDLIIEKEEEEEVMGQKDRLPKTYAKVQVPTQLLREAGDLILLTPPYAVWHNLGLYLRSSTLFKIYYGPPLDQSPLCFQVHPDLDMGKSF